MGKIGHMRKSVAFEAFKVQTISVHKMSEIYTIRPPKEITRSKWKKTSNQQFTMRAGQTKRINEPERDKHSRGLL